jgi:large subunit ribosomal protein L15
MIQHYADKYKVTEIDLNFLQEKSIVKKSEIVKVLANGELTSKVNVSAHAISASALEQIEKVGGTFTKL